MSKSKANFTPGPLSGTKVVDLTRALSGPICTMILADMGAETIRVEQPGEGGAERANQPGGADMAVSLSYFHRNKKSVTLDMKTDKGKDIFRRFIQWGDVLVENFRPGVMQKLGFDYPAVHEINPRIVMVSISGYGQTGPYSHRAGMDTVGQAVGGLMNLTGYADGPPVNAGTAVADSSAGMFGAIGALLALCSRQSTGLGQYVESSLTESIAFQMQWMISMYVNGLAVERGLQSHAQQRPGDGTFQTQEGAYVVIMAREDNHWPRLAKVMGFPDLATAPGYRTRAERVQRGVDIQELIAAWVRAHTIDEVEAALDKAGVPFGRVQTLAEVLNDPHLKSRGLIKELEQLGKVIPVFGPYPLLFDTPGSIRTTWPMLGQHNEEIYSGLFGFSKEELASLKSEGVI